LKRMNKLLTLIPSSILLVLSVVINLQAQTIQGKVIDAQSNPLTGASVYIDGTTIGAISDVNGLFSFTISNPINAAMVCSFIGYKTAYISQVNDTSFYTIQLEEDVAVLKEVVVMNNPFSRKQLMDFFIAATIGTGKVARNCTLMNKEAVRFQYNTKTLTLKVFADEPLLLQNNYLGYEISYNLQNFEAQFNTFSINSKDLYATFFGGTSSFKVLEETKKHVKRREAAYENSTLSFFRALAKDQLPEAGYQLYFRKFPVKASNYLKVRQLDELTLVKVERQERGLRPKNFQGELSILYKGKQQSKVTFMTDTFYIDSYGLYSDFYDILFSGAISQKKLGLMLPADYKME